MGLERRGAGVARGGAWAPGPGLAWRSGMARVLWLARSRESVPHGHLVGRRHVHLGDPVAVGHQRGPAAAPDPHHDLLGVVRLAGVVTVRPGGEGPDRTGVGG